MTTGTAIELRPNSDCLAKDGPGGEGGAKTPCPGSLGPGSTAQDAWLLVLNRTHTANAELGRSVPLLPT